VLSLNTFFSVAGVFVLRARGWLNGEAYQAWGYPFTPLIFLGLTLWTLVYILMQRPEEANAGLVVIGSGFAFYCLSRDKSS